MSVPYYHKSITMYWTITRQIENRKSNSTVQKKKDEKYLGIIDPYLYYLLCQKYLKE